MAADTRPWLTDWSTAPSRPRSFVAKIPRAIRPICPIDEYATTPRTSGWRKASSEPYTTPPAASTSRTVRQSSTGPGKWGSTIQTRPNTAAFETTPESSAATSGGDSVYAARSQPWNGSSGAFTANAATKPRKIQSLSLVPDSTRENVPCEMPKATIEASIRSEPAIV